MLIIHTTISIEKIFTKNEEKNPIYDVEILTVQNDTNLIYVTKLFEGNLLDEINETQQNFESISVTFTRDMFQR